jgi:translation initiation factor IF-3
MGTNLTTELTVNERITAKQVKLILDDKMIGVVSIRDALQKARERGLDLVVVSEGDIPVCRILNADRYRYERAKAERDHARKQREMMVDTKEIQLKPNIGPADLMTKARKAKGFLADGDKVKLVMRFKGREKSHKTEARLVIDRILAMIADYKIDKPLSDGDSEMILILGSNINKADLLHKKHDRHVSDRVDLIVHVAGEVV